MTRSESVNELAAALANAQAAIGHARKDADNPHFRHKYADLASVWDACRSALSAHGLSVVQSPRLVSGGESVWLVEVETTLFHASGQFLGDTLAVPVALTSAQAVGSAITYARRYALAALVGVAPAGDDDDGDRAGEYSRPAPRGKITPATAPDPPKPSGPHGSRVKVLGVVKRKLDDGRFRYVISGDDHKTYQSDELEHATKAKDAQAAGLELAIAYLLTPDSLRLIQSIEEIGAPQ
jgi:hypothetical protein